MSHESPPADRFETVQRVDTACPSCPCRFTVTVRRYERHVRMADAGGLVSYGSGLSQTIPMIPGIVARILGGERPAQIPFQRNTTKKLIVNLATARALGITLPAALVAQATETIR